VINVINSAKCHLNHPAISQFIAVTVLNQKDVMIVVLVVEVTLVEVIPIAAVTIIGKSSSKC